MAKRPKAAKSAPPTSTGVRELPYLARNPNQIAGGAWLVVQRSFCGAVAVSRQVYMPGVTFAVQRRYVSDFELTHWTHVPWSEETTLQSFLLGIKKEAVEHGAQAEAVQLLGELSPFDDKEMNIMAEKLAKKGAAKPKKEAAAKPAKAAPKKEAASNEPDKRKIAVLKKPHGAREGTKRADLLDTIYKAKTVQDAVDAGVAKNDVAWAAREGYIAVA